MLPAVQCIGNEKGLSTMKKLAAALVALSTIETAAFAQQCAVPQYQAPACTSPQYYHPSQGESAARPESGVRQPEGAYIRGPESGEFEGGSSSYGVKGFGFKLPAISFEGPEMRLPHLTRYRRNPVFHSESARAPFVRGPVTEFNQVPRQDSDPESAPISKPESGPAPYQCIPPVPCSSATEKRLRDELARKEVEIREMQDRFGQLENAVNRLTESQQQTREAGYRQKRPVPQPKIVEAGFMEEESEEEVEYEPQPVRRAAPRATRVAEAPAVSAPRASAPVKRTANAPREIVQPVPPNVGFSYIVEEEEAAPADDGLGVWKGDARRPVAKQVDGAAKRTSR